MTDVVLDASAVLVMLREEPGGDAVAAHVGRAAISAVNLQEVAKEMLREGASPATARAVSVRGGGGNSAVAGGVSGVAIEVYGQGGVCRLQPVTEGTADDQDQHVARRAA